MKKVLKFIRNLLDKFQIYSLKLIIELQRVATSHTFMNEAAKDIKAIALTIVGALIVDLTINQVSHVSKSQTLALAATAAILEFLGLCIFTYTADEQEKGN